MLLVSIICSAECYVLTLGFENKKSKIKTLNFKNS